MQYSTEYLAEMIGTMILVLLGNGVVANVLLRQTKGYDGGWLLISAGWGFAVYTAVLCVGDFSAAHINPAVTIGRALASEFPWHKVGGYIVAQMCGAILGALLVYVFYKSHYDATEDPDAKLATFCTAPNIRALPLNFFSETVGTFVLVYAVLMMADPSFSSPGSTPDAAAEETKVGLGSLGAIRVGLVVFAIGVSLGGTTGYAINPARDLGPRITHSFLPISGKRDGDWSYAWVPVLGPIAGSALAAVLFLAMGSN